MKSITNLIHFALKNSGSLFLVKAFGVGLNYVALLLVLHFFGFSGNGELANFIALSRGAMIVLIFGLDIVLVKRLNDVDRNNQSVILTATTLAINMVFFFLIIALLNLFFEISYFFYFGGIILAVWRYFSHFFRGKNNMYLYGVFEFVIMQMSILIAVLISESYGIQLVKAIIYINFVLIFLMILFFIIKYFDVVKSNIIVNNIKNQIFELYKEAYHFVISNSIVILSTSIIYVIINESYSQEVLGVYDAVLKFSQVIVLPLIATNGRVMVLVSKFFNAKQFSELKNYVLRTTKMLALMSSVFAVIVLITFFIYTKFFNLALNNYWTLFIFMVLAQLINNWAGPVGIVLQLTNNEKIFNKITFLASAYLIISTLMFSKYFSIEFIAINYMLYMFVQNFYSLKIIKNRLNINPYKI